MSKIIILIVMVMLVLSGCKPSVGNELVESGVKGEEVGRGVVGRIDKFQLEVDFGDKLASYSAELAGGESALSVLQDYAGEGGVEVKLKQYDFGSLVESVGGKKNTADRAWIFFVNGESGNRAADRVVLKPGDKVEWKYMKPIY